MPWPDKQRKAIAARMVREGRTPEEISAFFRKHGHGGDDRRRRDRRRGDRRKPD